MKNIPKRLAQIIRERLIEGEIDSVSDLLTEIQNKHFTVTSGPYTFTFRPSGGNIVSCVMVEKSGEKPLKWTGQDDKADPIDLLTNEELSNLNQTIRRAGLRAKIETRCIYQVMINGCVVTRAFDRGPQGDLPFPKELHSNEFNTQAEAIDAKRRFAKYHELFIKSRIKK